MKQQYQENQEYDDQDEQQSQKSDKIENLQFPLLDIQCKFSLQNEQCGMEIMLAADNTFLTYKCNYENNELIFQHINRKGKQLSRTTFKNIKYQDCWKVLMVNENQVAIVIPKQSKLKVWNFQNNKLVQTFFLISKQDGFYDITVFHFKDSQLLCICQRNTKQNKCHLSYFQLPLKNGDMHIDYCCLDITKVEIFQLNQNSKIGFIADVDLLQPIIEFKTYSLNSGNHGQLQVYKFSHSLNPKNINVFLAKITDCYQIFPEVFYFQIKVEVEFYKDKQLLEIISKEFYSQKCKQLIRDYQQFERYHSLYFYAKNKQVKQSKINFKHHHRIQFVNSIRSPPQNWVVQLQQERLHQKILNRKKWWIKSDPTYFTAPVYYADPFTQQILAYHPKQQKTMYYDWPNYKLDKVMRIFYEQQYYIVKQVKVKINIYPPTWQNYQLNSRIIIVFLLKEIEEIEKIQSGFDEDLLYQILKLS